MKKTADVKKNRKPAKKSNAGAKRKETGHVEHRGLSHEEFYRLEAMAWIP